MNLKQSNILQVLGEELFVSFAARHVPGRVVWCNFEIARELGFDVPKSNRLSERLHNQLIDAFSFRALQPKEANDGSPTITLYADKYGGDGVAPCRGSGRGAFAPYCDAFIKGLGHTPLYQHGDPDDFEHSHGGLNMDQAFAEAVFGEVNANLFEEKTVRVLAIIDQDDYTTYPKVAYPGRGRTFPRSIIIRVGNQLRPAHVLAQRCWARRSRLDLFLGMTDGSGQLVTRPHEKTGNPVPDLHATMLRVIDDHARIAAQQVRWRVTHLTLSASNMRMDGGMLDVTTERTHPRVAPIHPDHSVLDSETAPCPDYADRAQRLNFLWRTLRASMPKDQRRTLNMAPLAVKKEMDRSYLRHLQQQLLCATGLKPGVVERISKDRPIVAHRLVEVLIEMTKITNSSRISESQQLICDVAVLDVFNLLRTYPQQCFDNGDTENIQVALHALNPIYKGNASHVRRKRAVVMQLCAQFVEAYRQLMESCALLAAEHYDSIESMQLSIRSRAAFENRPVWMLFRQIYCERFNRAIAVYKRSHNLDIVRKVINGTIAHSVRSVDGLMKEGGLRRLAQGGVELEIKIIEGVRYAVRAWNDREQKRLLHISIPASGRSQYRADSPGDACTGTGLRYRFTVDRLIASQDLPAHFESQNGKRTRVACTIPFRPGFGGVLEGYFYAVDSSENERRNLSDAKAAYCFAVPDQIELAHLLTGS